MAIDAGRRLMRRRLRPVHGLLRMMRHDTRAGRAGIRVGSTENGTGRGPPKALRNVAVILVLLAIGAFLVVLAWH